MTHCTGSPVSWLVTRSPPHASLTLAISQSAKVLCSMNGSLTGPRERPFGVRSRCRAQTSARLLPPMSDSKAFTRSDRHFRRLQLLIEESDVLPARLDVLYRFVLVMHGIAKESCGEAAAQLGVSQSAVERAYCVAFDTLHLMSKKMPGNTDNPVVLSQ